MPSRNRTRSKLSRVKHPQFGKKFFPYKDKQIYIPGTVFGVEIPGYYYQAVVKRPDYKAGFLVVKFRDDNTQYRFAKSDVDVWMAQSCTPTVQSEEIANYAAEALISLKSGVEFGKDEEMRKQEEEEVQGRFQELFQNHPGIFEGIGEWGVKLEEETNVRLDTTQESRRRALQKKRARNYCLQVKVDEISKEPDSFTKRVKTIQQNGNIGQSLNGRSARSEFGCHGTRIQIQINQTSSDAKISENVVDEVSISKTPSSTQHCSDEGIKIPVNQSCSNSKIKSSETSSNQSSSSIHRSKSGNDKQQLLKQMQTTPRRSKRLSMILQTTEC